jgi:molybdate transport system ATP-binding protein
VRQIGSPQEVFERPADADVAAVVGVETAVPGVVVDIGQGLVQVRVGEQVVRSVARDDLNVGSRVLVCLRAEDVALEPDDAAGGGSPRNRLAATVTGVTDEGPLLRVDLDAGFRLASYITRPAAAELMLRPGSRVRAVVKSPAVHLVERSL